MEDIMSGRRSIIFCHQCDARCFGWSVSKTAPCMRILRCPRWLIIPSPVPGQLASKHLCWLAHPLALPNQDSTKMNMGHRAKDFVVARPLGRAPLDLAAPRVAVAFPP